MSHDCGFLAITRRGYPRRMPVYKSETHDAAIAISAKDQQEILNLYKRLQESEAKLVSPGGKTEILPNNLYTFLCQLLGELKAGKSVTILQGKAVLTTVEASKLLGMSRQYLVELLQRNELRYHMVGTHRRLYARDVLAYKVKRDSERRKILNDMAREEYDEGGYGEITNDDTHAQQ